MPIYEYRCEKCGAITEVLQLGKEENPSCTGCGSADLTKLMSAANVAMGGSRSSFSAPEGCCGSQDMCASAHTCSHPGCCGT